MFILDEIQAFVKTRFIHVDFMSARIRLVDSNEAEEEEDERGGINCLRLSKWNRSKASVEEEKA